MTVNRAKVSEAFSALCESSKELAIHSIVNPHSPEEEIEEIITLSGVAIVSSLLNPEFREKEKCAFLEFRETVKRMITERKNRK